MPRTGRLNLPGGLFHIIGRGIERRRIFSDNSDKQEFLTRLAESLVNHGHHCFAWALMDNHYHLLLRQGQNRLSTMMGAFLGAYAQGYNRRNNRTGYLFQGRFRSILCEEECYFLELIRYIHLNPVKAGMLSSVNELDSYPWTGHSELMGKCQPGLIELDYVLSHFSQRSTQARQKYRQFICAGLQDDYAWEDYEGGGLVRSLGSLNQPYRLSSEQHCRLSDERILGGTEFVRTALDSYDKNIATPLSPEQTRADFEGLIINVCRQFSVLRTDIFKRSRQSPSSRARDMLIFLATSKLSMSTIDLAEIFKISHQGISKAAQRGRDYSFSKEEQFPSL